MLPSELDLKRHTVRETTMSAKQWVDEAIDGYGGDDLHAVLIGSELWPEFLQEAGLISTTEPNGDVFVEYRDVVCRPSTTPDEINLVTGY